MEPMMRGARESRPANHLIVLLLHKGRMWPF